MGFTFTKLQSKHFTDTELLHKMECKLCPLYNISSNKNKDIKPHGSTREGDIYILGLGPGREEDAQGKFFVGNSGQYLRSHFTAEQISRIRFNNVVRTRPPEDDPSIEAIECCRPSVERDIELFKPRMIMGLGGYPLQWALRTPTMQSINAWRGHRFPVKIGSHVTWFWPEFHPAFILKGNDHLDHVFKLDIKNAYKFLERGLVPEVADTKAIYSNCHAFRNLDDILQGLAILSKELDVSVDLETTPTKRPYYSNSKIYAIAIGTKKYAISFPWEHPQFQWSPEDFKKLKRAVHVFIRNKKQKKSAHNLLFELEWLIDEYDDPLIAFSNWRDTMTPAYKLGYGGNAKESAGETEKLYKGLLSLDNLVMVYCGFFLKNFSGVDRANLGREPLEKVLIYNAGDTKFTDTLREKIDEDVAYEGLTQVVQEHDSRIPSIALMQRAGLCYDLDRARSHSEEVGNRITNIYNEVYKEPKVIEYQSKFSKFNIGAPADVAGLFEWLGYNVYRPDPKDKKKNKRSSDDEILKAIDHPLARNVLLYRENIKLKSTYVDIFLPENKTCVVFPDSLIHGGFTTHFTTSSRLSSYDPNLQNFPKKKNKNIRDIIVAPEGYVLASFDFGQIEYRVIVMASQDKKLIDYVWAGQDIHAEWGIKIAKKMPKRVGGDVVLAKWLAADPTKLKDEDKLFKAWRDLVKNAFVFAAFFGAGVPKLATGLAMPEPIVKEVYHEFWEEFAGAKKWHEDSYKFYAENGYIASLDGHRRYAYMQGGELINHPIQATAAAIMLDGMTRLSKYALETKQYQFQPRLSIHDDLSFYLPKASVDKDMDTIGHTMVDCRYSFINVPLIIESSYGPDWLNQKTYKIYDNSAELKQRLSVNASL